VLQLGAYQPSPESVASDVAIEETSEARLPGTRLGSASGEAEAATDPVSEHGRGMEQEIRAFLADIFFLGEDPASLSGDKSLITAGVIDSTGVLELVGFLEEEYGIRINDDELLPENLDTVENIVNFVSRKRESA
jgi:acyl carrier protein